MDLREKLAGKGSGIKVVYFFSAERDLERTVSCWQDSSEEMIRVWIAPVVGSPLGNKPG